MDKNNELKEFVFYTSPEGTIKVDVLILEETVWLTQKKMSDLFGVDVNTISEHIQNIFKSQELQEDSVTRKFRDTATDGKTYEIQFYNLDVIIAVGYRVNSVQATHFRKWSTAVLRDYIIKGFAIDDELLKNGTRLGKDYFEELLERIRDIRASERRFYQKITDIYSTAIDYDKEAEITQTFFKTVQNKLHFAIHGHTAAELIAERADADKTHMGLTSWKKSPEGKILKTDVGVGKNYLEQKELTELNRIVSMYLDYAENQAERGKTMEMNDWKEKLDAFLKFNDYEILNNPGKISMEMAQKLAEDEYEKFRPIQDKEFRSDFDEFVEKTKKLKNIEDN
ncbi:MAG: virulence RhuM family protein [Minisyncoccia bacterium]